MVASAPAGEAVGALEEFVADTGTPFGSERGDVGNGAEVKTLGVIAADDHRECVFKTEWFGNIELETTRVELLHTIVDGGGIALGRFIEDGGEGGTCVFDVEIEIAGEKGFVDEKSATEVSFADNVDAGFGFDVLGEKLGEYNLLSEEFGANGDGGLRWLAAGGGEAKESQEAKGVKDSRKVSAHSRENAL